MFSGAMNAFKGIQSNDRSDKTGYLALGLANQAMGQVALAQAMRDIYDKLGQIDAKLSKLRG
jgi:hypothetical protein